MGIRANKTKLTARPIGTPMLAVGLFGAATVPMGCGAPTPEVAAKRPAASEPAIGQRPEAPRVTPRDVVATQAIEALSYHRSTLRARCYEPTFAGQTPPPSLRFTLDVTFDPAGTQITRGITEDREPPPGAVTQCVIDHLPPLLVPPPGQVVMVEIPLKFP